jgi:hypothetical protein
MSTTESGRNMDDGDVTSMPSDSSAAFELGMYSRHPGTDMIIDTLLELADVVPPVVAQGLFFAVGKLETTFMLTVPYDLRSDVVCRHVVTLGNANAVLD